MLVPAAAETLARLIQHPALDDVLDSLRRGAAEESLAGLTDPAKAYVAAAVSAELRRPVLVLTESGRRAEAILEPLQFFAGALNATSGIALLPALDILPGRGFDPHPDLLEMRATTLGRLASGQVSVVVAPLEATLLSFASTRFYDELTRTLARDQEIGLEEVLTHLRRVGYVRTELVEMPGQFAVRGGILDVFPPEAPRPVRVELLGDTVESLREFDPDTQRSTAPVARVVLPPLTEFPLPDPTPGGDPEAHLHSGDGSGGASALTSLFDLCEDCIILLDEPDAIAAAALAARERLAEALPDGECPELSAPSQPRLISEEKWRASMEKRQRLVLERLPVERNNRTPKTLNAQPTTRYHGQVPAFLAEIRGRLAAREQVLIAAGSIGELERLADLCREYEVVYRLGEFNQDPGRAEITEDAAAVSSGSSAAVLVIAPLSEGFIIPDLGFAFYGTADLFETLPAPAARARHRPKTASFTSDLSELKPGDHVVHMDHGIGRFEGLQTLENNGRSSEFMRLRYADDAVLYVPLERMDLVQSYHSLGESTPQLDRLGGTVWTTRKSKVRKSVDDLADKLLAIYAERKAVPGFQFSPDTPWQREFEDAFGFTETPDQATAIADIKRDMERPQPMDRLLCGDVGYGKTEVAMRAAFKAVADSKQVAVLAPTTVLVFQHFQTFRQRMAAFPIRIEMLSRFVSPAEQAKVIASIEEGKVDIVIGTHRLLSRDIKFNNLGLLVVDEEQRFGVANKERLKEISASVDVLTMSATPIPRTLNMAMVGLRDLSVIETPPKDRLAIQTVVAPFSEEIVRRAIHDELDRGGQVFFVHNRVDTIPNAARLVQKLVPGARVVAGHGQMDERQLEKVMLSFIRGEADVLLSTTIIENGLDIPRANTILINRADCFGLSELYQLRGRVGRSNQRAYAYLLIPPEGSVTSIARQRLAALREFSELGAGFRIAALDLELRGAGNLLGREQHGHINAIGFDLYTQMLERAVAARKGEAVVSEIRATLSLGLDIRIPPEYVPGESLRLKTYKRIAGVTGDADREAVRRELADRFGPPPLAVDNLLDYAVLKALCERLHISSVERRADQVTIKFQPLTPVTPERLVALVHRHKNVSIDPSGVMKIRVPAAPAGSSGPRNAAEAIRNVLLPLEAAS